MNTPTVREVQQMFGELLSHNDGDITWDLLTENQSEILKRKTTELYNTRNLIRNYYMNKRDAFQLIWNQRKYTNGQSLTSLFFVMIVDDVSDSKLAEQSTSWSLYPVFRCRRCVEDNSGRNRSSLDCCMVYVTYHWAVESWDVFLKGVGFPPGYMVTPDRGVYKMVNGQVQLKTYPLSKSLCSILREGSDRCISPGTLKQSPQKCLLHHDDRELEDILRSYSYQCTCEGIYFQLLEECNGQKPAALCVAELSLSLALFTHSVNNFQLARKIVIENSYHGVLSSELRSQFKKIARDMSRFKDRMNPVRSAAEVPTKAEMDKTFQRVLRKPHKEHSSHQELLNTPVDLLPSNIIQVKEECINLEDYGPALKEHILSTESFEDLIGSMADNLEPEMFKLILKLTQDFMENTRDELLQLLKYHFSTETVLYQIIVCILRKYSNLNFKEVEQQSMDILWQVRYYFASACPNSRTESLKKCPKCVGYYDVFIEKECQQASSLE